MRYAILLLILMTSSSSILYDFTTETDSNAWRVQDDRVMGGISQGNFEITDEGHGHFHGYVTTENNGGFSSIQKRIQPLMVGDAENIKIRLKGDGKRYQFRIKAGDTYYSYAQYFQTSGEWETIELPLQSFSATYRGRDVDVPNFDQQQITNLRFLIGNKKKQEFDLLIDKVWME